MRTEKGYAIVTGGNTGIGLAMAKNLAAKGFQLILVARDEQALLEAQEQISNTHPVEVRIFPADLTDEVNRLKLLAYCQEEKLQVIALINNAGMGQWGYFNELEHDAQRVTVMLNMEAVMHLCHLFIPLLSSSGDRSYMLNVGSIAGHQVIPTMTIYSATKAFIRSFSRGLHHELKSKNIHVCCVSPGPVATNFIERANMTALQHKAAMLEISPERVAKSGIHGMLSGKIEVVPGFLNKLHCFFLKILPLYVFEVILGKSYVNDVPKR